MRENFDRLLAQADSEIKGWPGFWIRADGDGFTMKYGLGRSRFLWADIDGELNVVRGYVGFRLHPSGRATPIRRILFATEMGASGPSMVAVSVGSGGSSDMVDNVMYWHQPLSITVVNTDGSTSPYTAVMDLIAEGGQ